MKTTTIFGKTESSLKRAKKEKAQGIEPLCFSFPTQEKPTSYDIVTEKKTADPVLNIKRMFSFALDSQLSKPPRRFCKKEYESLECPVKTFDYWYTSIYYRNLAMIDQSDLALFNVGRRENSGAYNTTSLRSSSINVL